MAYDTFNGYVAGGINQLFNASVVQNGTNTETVTLNGEILANDPNSQGYTLTSTSVPGQVEVSLIGSGKLNTYQQSQYQSSTGILFYESNGSAIFLANAPVAQGDNGRYPAQTVVNDGSLGTFNNGNLTCFAGGTLIRTPRGDVAVEDLEIGDVVVTADGRHRPVRWLGSRTIDCRTRAAGETSHPAWPVRIAAHAFGPGRPDRDLFVSSGHAIAVPVVDEMLVPASALVNGATIARVEVDEITYWHVELDGHDVLLANGLPAESYIGVGNRDAFTAGRGDIDPSRDGKTLADYCRPFVEDADAFEIRAIRSRLRERARASGWTLRNDAAAEIHALVDGQPVRGEVRGRSVRFVIPAAARAVSLVSATSAPSDYSDNLDARPLGLNITGLAIQAETGERRDVAIEDGCLDDGFYPAEIAADGPFRWTKSEARLPAALWRRDVGACVLEVTLGAGVPRWQAPVVPSIDLSQKAALRLAASA